MKPALALIAIGTAGLLLGTIRVLALNSSLDVSEDAHILWTDRDGFSVGSIFAMAPAAYLTPTTAIAEASNTSSAHATKPELRPPSEETSHSPARQGQNSASGGGHVPVRNLKFTHLTTDDGLSQGYVTAIVQDHRGFMWFATRDGLNRYDGNAFVIFKNSPNDPASLTSNFIQDLMEDDHGYLWLATNTGVDRFDPGTERCTRYLHDAKNSNSIGGAAVKSITKDTRGYIWIGTEDAGLDKLDPSTGTFTHYRTDSDGQFVGRITQVIADKQAEVWFVGERGLFHLNADTGRITHPGATSVGLSAESLYADETGNLWILIDSPIAALVKYERQAERFTKYPISPGPFGVLASTTNGGSANSLLAADGQNGLWVPSSLGLFYFDKRSERFTYRFQHDETDPYSLDSNAILSVYQDRGGVLWVGTENAGLNLLNFQQEQFASYRHRPGDPDSISPGRVKAIYQESNGVLWLGFFPLALDRLNQKTGQITHYFSRSADENALGKGTNIDTIYRDAAGHLWVGGGGNGLARLDERTGRFKHYRHNPHDPNSLISNNVYTVYGDQSGDIWIGQDGGVSRYNPTTDRFTNYRLDPDNPAILVNTVWSIYEDHSGTLWLGTWGGALSRFDQTTATFVSDMPDPHDAHRLHGGGINSIHEDRTGTLWVGTFDGLYRYNRQNKTFTRYTEEQGLASGTVRCIQEDGLGKLWLSTDKGISRFDPQDERSRNYDASDGLQGNEFSTGCYQGRDGQMFFGGTNGFNAFYPENVRDNSYVPPVVITRLKIFNEPVSISTGSVLKKAVPYVNFVTIPYRDNVFSFEFAALSYANSQKNRYRYKLEGFEAGWNEVGSNQRLATYTNLDPGKYVFRVQGSNSDGVWNAEGVALSMVITPPWWRTNWFRGVCAAVLLGLLWAAYQLRIRQLRHQFAMTLETRVGERTRIARDLHDTLLQSFHGLLFRFQAARNLLPNRPEQATEALDAALVRAEQALDEGRHSIQELRPGVAVDENFDQVLIATAQELSSSPRGGSSPRFQVIVQGVRQALRPMVHDEVVRIARELLRNAFQHAGADQIEAEIRYDNDAFRLLVRDDGKGIDPKILKDGGRPGHWGLPGVNERARGMGARLEFWSQAGAGTEVRFTLPAAIAYGGPDAGPRLSLLRKWRIHEHQS